MRQLNAVLQRVDNNQQLTKDRRKLAIALKELYRGLELMRNFRVLNYTAFVKICKKHDKNSMVREL